MRRVSPVSRQRDVCKIEKMEEYMEDKCSFKDEQLGGALVNLPLLMFTDNLKRFRCGWRF